MRRFTRTHFGPDHKGLHFYVGEKSTSNPSRWRYLGAHRTRSIGLVERWLSQSLVGAGSKCRTLQ